MIKMELSNSKRPFTSTVQVNGPFAGNARLAPSRARQQCQAALPPPQSISLRLPAASGCPAAAYGGDHQPSSPPSRKKPCCGDGGGVFLFNDSSSVAFRCCQSLFVLAIASCIFLSTSSASGRGGRG